MITISASFAYEKINTIVSILPQQTFVKAIGKDKVNVSVMVLPGNSPHSYEPKPSQMKEISQADVYFAIGVEFEHAWLKRFQSQNNSMKMVDLTHNIKKIAMKKHSHDKHNHEHESLDPHIWTSPNNVTIMAKSILDTLVELDSTNEQYYKDNYNEFLSDIKSLQTQIRSLLKPLPPHTKFMVFHPAWGYFADEFDLIQVSIEVEGKEPKPKELAHLMEEAKEENIKAIFTQPEFSDTSANLIAKQLQISVIKASPLNPNWSKNLLKLASAIAIKN